MLDLSLEVGNLVLTRRLAALGLALVELVGPSSHPVAEVLVLGEALVGHVVGLASAEASKASAHLCLAAAPADATS